MKIQFEEKDIRLRLDNSEYDKLLLGGVLSFNLQYLPLSIILKQVSSEMESNLSDNKLLINISREQILLLSAPSMQKNGVNLWLNTPDKDVLLSIQLDLVKQIEKN